jgi:hypothetical protein
MIKIATHQIGDTWTDGTSWGDMGLGLPSNTSPSIKVFNNKAYLRFSMASAPVKYRLYISNDGVTLNPNYIQLPTSDGIYDYIVGDNNRLFIAGMHINSEDGVWYTDDNGENWVKVISAPYIDSFFRSSSGTLFAASNSIARRSTDNGVTWTECSYIPQCETSTGKLIYFEDAQVYVSTNSGVSWSLASEMPVQGHDPDWIFENFAILDSGAIFRTVYDNTDEQQLLFRSTDECNSWECFGHIPNSKRDSKIYAAGNRLLHITNYATESGGTFVYHYEMYASDNNGNTWSLLHATEAGGVADIQALVLLNSIRAISIERQCAYCMRHSDVTTETVALKYLDKDATRELINQAIGYVDDLVN